MLKTGKKILCTLLVVVMCLTSAPLQGFVGLDFSSWFASEAEAAGVSTNETYWAMSPSEAKGFIGFLYDTSNVTSEMMNDGNIYNFLTGNLTKGSDEEIKARLYFCMFAASSINQHIDSTGTAISVSSDFLIQYLKDKSGGDIDDGLANSILGDVKDSIKKTLIYSFNVAEETVDNLSLIKTAYDLITDLPGKINQFVQDAQAALSAFILVLSHSKRARYSYVSGRVSNMSCSAYSNPDVAEIMDWYTDFAVHENNAFAGLDFANKWDTVEHKEILDKYAKFIYLANNSSFKSSNDIKTMEVHCPTDVYAYNKLGECVISIIDNKVDYCADGYFAAVKESYKLVVSTFDEELNIKIRGTDNGTMDCSVKSFNEGGMLREIKYDDVYLDENIEYSTLIPEDTFVDKNEYTLVSNNGNLIGADYDSLPPIEENIVDVVVAEELFDGFPIEVIDLVADTMFNMKSVVDLAAYDISTDDAVALFSAVAKYYPAEYSLIANSDFTYKIIVSPNLDRIMKIRFYYGDDANLSTYQKRVKDLNAEIDALVAKVEGMDDFEKALYIHDYIVLNSEYDLELLEYMEANNCILPGELRSEKYTEYSILVNGTGVCGSYALAYRAVLNAAGMECLYLSSGQMNHAWNLVKIDGKWYHVDCCWDDPTPDTYGRARRTYFLRTDKEIMDLNHYSWTPGQYKANSEKYSDMPRNYDIKQKYDDGKWYYLEGTTLYSSDVDGKNETEIASITASAIDVDDGNIYYSMGRYVCSLIPETNKTSCVYFLDSNHSGDDLNRAIISNIYIDEDDIVFYKSIYDKEKSKTVTLYDEDILQREKFDKVNGISISDAEIEIDVFSEKSLNVAIESTGSVEGLEIIWASSDDSIVSVNKKGEIKGLNVGEATITASVLNFKVECKVKVNGDGLSGICGDNAIWSFEPNEGILTISGSGAMTDYSIIFSNQPWLNFRDVIKCVEIESGISKIGDFAFCRCENLSNIIVPDSVTSIGSSAFSNCNSLKSIIVDENNSTYSSDEYGVLFDKYKTTLIDYPVALENTSYIIPECVTVIGNSAFSGSLDLVSVTIPDSVVSIESSAFSNCKKMTTINIPDKVTFIGNTAFTWCVSLSNITIPESVAIIGDNAFRFCENLEFIAVDGNNKNYCTDEFGVLYNKDKTILIHSPAKNGITSYTIPKSVTKIETYAFYMSHNLENVDIHDNVESIGVAAFADCTSLENIVIPKKISKIEANTFNGCTSLANIKFSDNIKTIDSFAFSYCSSLTNVKIPDGVVNFSGFGNCSNLVSINIPASVTSRQYGLPLFYGCDNLKSINVDPNNKVYSSDEYGVLFDKEKTMLMQYPAGNSNSSYCVPDTVERIGSHAFENSKNLRSITISNDVSDIEGYVFDGCENLMHIGFKCSEDEYSNIDIDSNNNQLLSIPYIHFDFDASDIIFVDESQATCIDDGNTAGSYCVYCNCYIDGKIIPAKGHNYNVVESAKGNCVTAPYDVYSCANCNDTYTKTGNIDNGHSYVETVIAPTCTEKGYTTATCTVCDETVVYDFTSPLGHKLVINRSASQCTEHGTLEYSCKNCDYTELVAADTTNLVTETVTVEPTCTKSGTKSEICVLCGATVSTEILNPLSHNYSDEWIVDTEATCTEKGSKSKHCTRCDAKREVIVVEEAGHKYHDKWLERVAPTCEKDGLEYRNCYVCNNAEETRVVGKLGHNYSLDWTVDIEPTCTAKGSKSHHCTRCSSKSDVTEVAKLNHSYKSVVTAPTCTVKGYTTHTCTSCGDVYTDSETSALGHKMSAYVVTKEPTCTDKGTEMSTCNVCTHTETRTINANGHNYKDGVCTGCGKSKVENCTHMCHKGGFMGFIWKIVRFFWKLFRMNPTCECGIKHY